MQYPHFIASGNDQATGQRMTLWHRGNYLYEIDLGRETIEVIYSNCETALAKFSEIANVYPSLSREEQ